ncbi:MAG TPA: sigma-70 family RNA polymerase sigma factor [Planctomycetota bacterium]|nr:sigma-70 family RNA polymerase sigma factor [Planctomycetota bacterium]
MDAEISNAEIERLLAHSEWLSGLARRLVRDPGAAEDLVQDTWHAALRSGQGKERGWLATVISNLARARARGEVARRERERHFAPSEDIEGPDQLVQRAESQRNLLAHVLALDEPYRTTLLARYVEGRSAAEIARRSGVNESTVRTRLARALEQLRARLSSEHRDDRMLGLAGLLTGSRSASTTTGISTIAGAGIGALIMSTTTKIALAAAVLLCAWLAWMPSTQDSTDVKLATDTQTPSSTQGLPSLESSNQREALEQVAAAPAPPAEPVLPAKPAAAERKATFEILFTRDGAPVPDVTAWLIFEEGPGFPMRRNAVFFHKLLDSRFTWPSDCPKQASDSRGIATFEELPAATYFIGFETSSASDRPTHLGAGMVLSGRQPRYRFELRLGSGSIHGTVFDDLGRPRPGVGVMASVRDGDPLRKLRHTALTLTDERGAYRLADLRDAEYDVVMEIDANFDGRGEAQQTSIRLGPGEDRELDFGSVLPASRWSGRLLNAFGEPFPGTPRLALERERSADKLTTPCDDQGKFQVAFTPGNWRVHAFAAGCSLAGFDLGVHQLPEADLVRDLIVPGCRLQGRVSAVDPAAALPQELFISLHPKNHDYPAAFRDGAVVEGGHFQIDGLEPGTWVMDIWPGALETPNEFDIYEGVRSVERDLRWILR